MNPKDMRYKAHFERMVFRAAVAHVDRGRVLKQSGDYAGRWRSLRGRYQIDPGNQAAQQEIEQLQKLQARRRHHLRRRCRSRWPDRTEVLSDIGSVSGPVQLQPMFERRRSRCTWWRT